MACQIKDGQYLAPNGNKSKLYKDLSKLVGESKASDLFIFSYSDNFAINNSNFTKDENGEFLAENVLQVAREQNENTEPFTTAEKVELQVQFENLEELPIELEKAFYKNGLFNPTLKTLTKSLYTRFEAENLLSDLTLLSKVKDSVERLKRTEDLENNITLDTQFKSSELNMFGKFKVLNPNIVKQDFIEEFGGVENPQIEEFIVSEEELKTYKRIPIIDENGEPVLNKVIYENGAKLVTDPTIFQSQTESQFKERLLDYGVRVDNVSPITLKNFIENPSVENTLALNENSPQREKVVKIEKQERDLVYLETLKTEEEIFNELSLIQTETQNVYHRVEKVEQEELRTFLKAESNVSEYQLYKDYYNYTTPTTKEQVYTKAEIVTDIEYLKEEFVADFNAEILKNPTHEFYNKFYVNEKGINIKYDDNISLAQIRAYLKDGVKFGEELVDYSNISKNMPNFKDETFEVNDRIFAINNKNRLKKLTTQVTPIDKNTMLAKNETTDFINHNNEVFELKNKEGSDSVYMKLNIVEDLNYYQTEVQTQGYTDQIKVNRQNLENYNSAKKAYKKEDLDDNFDCQ